MYTSRTPLLTILDDFVMTLLSLSALVVAMMPCTLQQGAVAFFYGGIAFIALTSCMVRMYNGVSRH